MPASPQVLSNAKLWINGFDFSGDHNALALKYGADIVDATVLSQTTRSRLPGLQFFSFQHEGLWSGGAGNIDDAIFNSAFALQNTEMSIDPQTGGGIEGDLAYTGQVNLSKYEPGAKIGDALAFSVSGDSDGAPLVRGTLLANRTVVATGNGSVFQLGAVLTGQLAYAALHVLAPVAGTTPTLNVKVQSAALVGFGSPVDRIIFAQASASGSQWGAPAVGPITDQFWRVTYTVGGTGGPSFPFVVVAGFR
jgi:hypothetical protein